MLRRIKQWLGLSHINDLNQNETSPLEKRAKSLIFQSQSITTLIEASTEIQGIFDSEKLSLEQMMKIGELYEKQIGRIMLMRGEVKGLNITFYETEEHNILTTKNT